MKRPPRKPRSAKVVLSALAERFDTLAGMYENMRKSAHDNACIWHRKGQETAMREAAQIVRSIRP